MARNLEVIQQQIIDQLVALGINVSGSRTSIRRKWTYVCAYCAWVIERLFDSHKDETLTIIGTLKPHSLQWYQQLALSFQFGQNINPLTGEYDNVGLTDAQVAAQKIVARASVTEVDGKLRLKVARYLNGDLAPLSAPQLVAFTNYIQKKKDAGVKITIDSLPPDDLRLVLDVFFNPLVLTSTGARIDGISTTPVPDAINEYLGNLPFNGEYANTRLIDALQKVEGVDLPVKISAKSKYGLFPYTEIDERYIADGGYIRIQPADLIINYRPYVQY